jgi:isoquinoline 1-oxidoreductase subunit beta
MPQPHIRPEDLAADWDKVRIAPAPIIERIYRTSASDRAMTLPGSTACAAYYDRLRAFGARVRHVLLENAARKGDGSVGEPHERPSIVVHVEAFAAAVRDLEIAMVKQGGAVQILITRKWSA